MSNPHQTEYEVMQTFRLEWSKMGHNWGYVVVPLSFTIPTLLFIYKESVWWIGLIVCIGLNWWWRCYHHYVDKNITLLYSRLWELEDEMNMQFTKEYLRTTWADRLSPHSTADEVQRIVNEGRVGGRGLEQFDRFSILYSLAGIALIIIWYMGRVVS